MSQRVYLDNAATTPLAPEVFEEMAPMIRDSFGNPSSTHAFGRQVKGKMETARRKIAQLLRVTPGEIVFTSGGTEADNMALTCAVRDLGVKHIITSSIEHHAVLHTAEDLADRGLVQLHFVKLEEDGCVDLQDLERLFKQCDQALVSLMHANNEIGNLLQLDKVSALCREHGVLFHSDTVQTMGHYPFDLSELDIDFVTCAAHKFHGPKGVGFLYVNRKLRLGPMIHGGSQERNLRGGTENVYGIVGLAKAMELAFEHLDEHRSHIEALKARMIERLTAALPGVEFNGTCKQSEKSLYTVLSVSLPPTDKAAMLLFSLDLRGVAASSGSACSSGSNVGSHVLQGIQADTNRPFVRFSFSRYTTEQEIDYAVESLREIYEA